MAKRIILSGCLSLLAWTVPCAAQVITGFVPQQATPGSSFTLRINGSGFINGSVVQFSPGTGITVSATQVKPTQITASVQIAANSPSIPRTITVVSALGPVTAPGSFAVTPALALGVPPMLTSVGPGLVAQRTPPWAEANR